PSSAIGASKKAALASGRLPVSGQSGVNRPLRHGVNVFFDFGLNDTYQIGRPGRHQMSKSPSKTPSKSPRKAPPALADLRREIDRIDASMHELLIERAETIDQLIAVKKTEETGSAFRPAREAEMMRRLVRRHHGSLPLDTAESIWRVIISTFTYVQSPF